MKKGIYVILLCFVFLGCACNNYFDVEKLPIDSSETVSKNYYINTEIYKDSDESKKMDISIKYPKIEGLKDTVMQDSINNLIKEAALEPYYKITNTNSGITKDTEWPIDYSIVYATDDILSVKFEGYIYTQGSAHGTNWVYSININLTNGQKITIDKLFDESFQEKLTSQYFKGIDVDTTKSDYTAIDEIFDHFKNSFENSDNNFYFTDDKFVIILPINDFYQFSSSYENLKSAMKQDNSVWKYILDEE